MYLPRVNNMGSKRRSKKKRNRIVFLSILCVYAVAVGWRMITIAKPYRLVAEATPSTIIADGVNKSIIKVFVYDNKGNVMSGQKVTFVKLEGTGKVLRQLDVTLGEGYALGQYTSENTSQPSIAKILCENGSGLQTIVEIKEMPNAKMIKSINLKASVKDIALGKMGSDGLDVELDVEVLDEEKKPIASQAVHFSVLEGNGDFFGFRESEQITDQNGKAAVVYHLRKKVGMEKVVVRSVNNPEVESFIEIEIAK